MGIIPVSASARCLNIAMRSLSSIDCVPQLDGVDYIILPGPAYDELVRWYGEKQKPAVASFPRRMVADATGFLRVDLFPQLCVVTSHPHSSASSLVVKAATARLLVSRKATLPDFLDAIYADKAAATAFNLTSAPYKYRGNVRLWHISPLNSNELDVPDPSATIGDLADNYPQSDFKLELRSSNGAWHHYERNVPDNTLFVTLPDETDSAVQADDDAAWRRSLAVRSLLDYKTDEGVWVEAEILKITNALSGAGVSPSEGSGIEDTLEIRAIGASDEPGNVNPRVNRDSNSLAGLHKKSPPWRFGLRPGDRVEVRGLAFPKLKSHPKNSKLFFLGWVLDLDHTRTPPTIRVAVSPEAMNWPTTSTYLSASTAMSDAQDFVVDLDFMSGFIRPIGSTIKVENLKHLPLLTLPPPRGVDIPPIPAATAYTENCNDTWKQFVDKIRAEQNKAKQAITAKAPYKLGSGITAAVSMATGPGSMLASTSSSPSSFSSSYSYSTPSSTAIVPARRMQTRYGGASYFGDDEAEQGTPEEQFEAAKVSECGCDSCSVQSSSRQQR